MIDVDAHGTLRLNVPKTGRKPVAVSQHAPRTEFEAATDDAIEQWFDADRPVKSCLLDDVTDTKTLEEIADVLCMTRERVRQIEKTGLEKLSARKVIINE